MSQSPPILGTREGFRLKRDRFTLPKDTSALDPKSKRAVTICNLFVNHKLALSDIVRLLDEDNGKVVLTLLEQRIIQDRRVNPNEAPDGRERRKATLFSWRRWQIPNHPMITPMVPLLLRDPFDRDGRLFELKWDGFRAIAETDREARGNKSQRINSVGVEHSAAALRASLRHRARVALQDDAGQRKTKSPHDGTSSKYQLQN
jgi:hypothetical protein